MRQPLLDEEAAGPGSADAPGDVIGGKYQLEHVLGEGGMGVVWRARNLALDSPVAIKVLSRAHVDRDVLRERLLLEAKAAAKLAHPAIVKVFDVDQTERGEPFIVMELLPGTSLGAVLTKEGRVSAARAVSVLLPIAEALKVAHEHGIVHRDVKPDNILIVEDDGAIQPKLLDFGIVKIQRDGGNITEAGLVVGSPDYMSPEQAKGQEGVDYRSDVWGFSVSLYESIAGRPPFAGANYNALLRQILEHSPPSLHELGLVDAELSAIVARGLSKRPEQRGTIGEMGESLAGWLLKQGMLADICGTALAGRWLHGVQPVAGGKSPPQSARRSGKRRFGLWLALVIALAVGLLVSERFRSAPEAPPDDKRATGEASATPSEQGAANHGADQDVGLIPIVGIETLGLEDAAKSAQKPKHAAPSAPAQQSSTPSPGATQDQPKDLLNPY